MKCRTLYLVLRLLLSTILLIISLNKFVSLKTIIITIMIYVLSWAVYLFIVCIHYYILFP